ncbi:DUF3397 domain-containing protein [Paenibacillus sp. P96]|uniref:DUF3397 domain-containing protein n=1 Tax=Paenibacillus zeirhizosphaerae TaxID=2987519 RepID=A0ABT9FQG0_9BACL|nr:DUF3397 domain-containing protein [Paenibacillus sp. P96]MDP4096951.1 DUF3397 domain-containing protein [Paenibacillus sp. P96]
MSAVHNTLVFLSVLPFFPFLIVYGVGLWITKNKKRSLLAAIDVTTLFLIVAVAALFNIVFGTQFGIYLISLLLLITLGLIGGAQNRLKGGVNWRRLIRAVWRITFIGTGFAYLLFTFIGIFGYIINYMS